MNQNIEDRMVGTFRQRFWTELLGNSIQFPIVNVLFEVLLEGVEYFLKPDLYIIALGAVVQAYCLTRWQDTPRPRRFWGNLIGPALYTAIEAPLEGLAFFTASNHLAYWFFSINIGALQALNPHLSRGWRTLATLLENLIRASLLLFMYGLFEIQTNPAQTTSLGSFFGDASHQFIVAATLLLGLSVAWANLLSQRYLSLLRETSAQLRVYSEWLLGSELLNRLITNPNALALVRRNRVILFMDIRNFTAWSETHASQEIASLLMLYYRIAETVFDTYPPVKFKLSADEVMAVFAAPDTALAAALRLRAEVGQQLAAHQLAAGIGLHEGEVIEGLLGASAVKFYDVLGDVVNTAKRIESQAQGNEILVSESLSVESNPAVCRGAKREVSVKGKSKPLTVYALQELSSGPQAG